VTVSPVDAARALFPVVREAAETTERGRRLPLPIVAALAEAGLFRLCVPRVLGGTETDPTALVLAIEEIARADGSAGWCTMIGATTGLLSGYLAEDAAREIFARDPNVVTGGVVAARGRAAVVDGGYRVTGRWPFASGCQHCAWLVGGCLVEDGGSAAPAARMMMFPATAVEIIDTWTVSGLCGSGSHDIAVSDLFVPVGRTTSLVADRPRQPGPLYQFPLFGLLALGIAAVTLGIARTAIDELVELAGGKTPTGGRRRLAERPAVQADVAQAEAELRAARAFLLNAIADAWNVASTRGTVDLGQRALLRLAATHATVHAAGVVDRMYNAGGGTSVYATSLLQRCFRDVHTATQHMMVGPPTWEFAGRLLLGIDTDTSTL